MTKKMIGFFCATPYQIFNCINLKLSEFSYDDADIYLLTFASDLSKYKKSLENSGLFRHVYLVYTFDGSHGIKDAARLFLFLDKDLNEVLKSKKYDVMFCTCMGFVNTIIYTRLYRNNPKIQLMYYDEGIGIYCVPLIQASQKLKLFLKLFHGRDYFANINCLYAYLPDSMLVNREFEVKKISRVVQKDKDVYNKIFEYRQESDFYTNKRFVYLDQAYKKQLGIPIDNGKLLQIIGREIPQESIAVKLHPTRTPDDAEYADCMLNIAPKTPIPWEVQLLNMNLQEKVFISINSTACITPKMVFDQEPIVVLLYRLVPECLSASADNGKAMEQFFEKVRDSYQASNRFFIPETVEELIQILRQIK